MNVSDLFGLVGTLGIALMLLALGKLSRRLGEATSAPPHYRGFYAGALCVFLSATAQGANLVLQVAPPDAIARSTWWVIIYNGLPAAGITLGLMYAWRYWSWLLAERN